MLTRIPVALSVLLAVTVGVGLVMAQPPDKVTVCHNLQPGEDLDGDGDVDEVLGTTIDVSEQAVPAHEAHGDIVSYCEDPRILAPDIDGDKETETLRERPSR